MTILNPVGLHQARDLLRRCLKQGSVRLSRHFREELSNDGLDFADAWHVAAKSGLVFDPPEFDIKFGEWNYKIEGHTPDGDWLVIVFSFEAADRAVFITAWTVEAKGV